MENVKHILLPSWRQLYLVLIPSLVALFLPLILRLIALSLPRILRRYIIDIPHTYIGSFITLEEIYADSDPARPGVVEEGNRRRTRKGPPLWKVVILVSGALIQAFCSLAQFSWLFLSSPDRLETSWPSLVLGCAWSYAACLPIFSPRPTPHATLVTFYSICFCFGSSLTLLTVLYEYSLLPPIPHGKLISNSDLAIEIANLVLNGLLIAVSLSLPIQSVPVAFLEEQNKIVKEDGMGSSPEDWTPVWSWMTFSWVEPLIKKGTSIVLDTAKLYVINLTALLSQNDTIQACLVTSKIPRSTFSPQRSDASLCFDGSEASKATRFSSGWPRAMASISSGTQS